MEYSWNGYYIFKLLHADKRAQWGSVVELVYEKAAEKTALKDGLAALL